MQIILMLLENQWNNSAAYWLPMCKHLNFHFHKILWLVRSIEISRHGSKQKQTERATCLRTVNSIVAIQSTITQCDLRRCDNTSDYMTASTNIVVRTIELKRFDYRVNFFCVAELANNDNRRISWMKTIYVKWHVSLFLMRILLRLTRYAASQLACLFVNFTFSMCASICHAGENILIKSSIFLFWEFTSCYGDSGMRS